MSDDVPHFVVNPPVFKFDEVAAERHGNYDLYVPEGEGPFPAVVMINGGPLPIEVDWKDPRKWPVYRGYASVLSQRGVVTANVQLPLNAWDQFDQAAKVHMATVEKVRSDPRVDPDRIAIWSFCAGSPILSEWLRDPPSWLRCISATYPALGSREYREVPARFLAADVVAEADPATIPPFLLTRVGLELEDCAETVATFLAAAEKRGVSVDIIDVPHGRHGFDSLDYSQESIDAIYEAMDYVLDKLRE